MCTICDSTVYCKNLCKSCYQKEAYVKNRERRKAKASEYYYSKHEINKEKSKIATRKRKGCKPRPPRRTKEQIAEYVKYNSKRWKKQNPEKYKENARIRAKRRFDRNKTKELALNPPKLPSPEEIAKHKELKALRKKEHQKKYKESPKGRAKSIANCAARRARKKHAEPKWVNKVNIEYIYLNCPKGYEVDHIIPLMGKEVCGLHVEWNLQYLTRSENAKKYNKLTI